MINKEIKNEVYVTQRYSLYSIFSTSLGMFIPDVTVDNNLGILVLLFSSGSQLVKLLIRVFLRATEKKMTLEWEKRTKAYRRLELTFRVAFDCFFPSSLVDCVLFLGFGYDWVVVIGMVSGKTILHETHDVMKRVFWGWWDDA